MTQTEKDNINKRTENRHLLRRIRAGFAAAKATPYKGLLLALYLVGAMLVWLLRAHLFSLDTYGLFSPVLGVAIDLLIHTQEVTDSSSVVSTRKHLILQEIRCFSLLFWL